MRPITVTAGPLTSASANAIALSQTPSAAFTLNGASASGGVATLDTPRRVLFTYGADESAKTMTITGTTWGGFSATDVVTGTATTAQSAIDFLTVTSITVSATLGAAATVGTNGVASSAWARLDNYAPAPAALQCTASGTVNYTVEQTLQDPNSPTNPVNPYQVAWGSSADPNVVGATTTQVSSFNTSPIFTRVTLNSGTGSVSMVVAQHSVAPY